MIDALKCILADEFLSPAAEDGLYKGEAHRSREQGAARWAH